MIIGEIVERLWTEISEIRRRSCDGDIFVETRQWR